MLKVCDCVYYGLDGFGRKRQSWRVTQCYRKQTVQEFDELYPMDCEPIREFIELDRLKSKYSRMEQGLPTNEFFRLIPCLPEEATHVELTSVGAAIAPIEECEFIEVVPWSQELIESHQSSAANRIANDLNYYEWKWA